MIAPSVRAGAPPHVDPALQHAVEQFLYWEAAVLDDRRWSDWLEFFTDDCRYYMPTRYNRTRREMDHEFSRADEVAHFDDDLASLRVRVKRLLTGQAWAEDPPSRTRHMITNVRIEPIDGGLLRVHSCFHCYRSRLDRDVETFVGRREDTLRPATSASWRIAQREIFLDQTVILAKNISIFL
jgi:3-phenylpropionate/cinnamic acid dioxygenase small subunit